MDYLLYLKQSFRRSPQRHLSFLLILLCAFVLPLFFSIYLDSSDYGRKQQLMDHSKGETFHITGVEQSDCERFTGIAGLSAPRYEEGTLYLHILDREEWKDYGTLGYYGMLLQNLVEDGEKISIKAMDYNLGHGIPNDDERRGQRIIWLFMLFVLVITAFIIRSAYESHLHRFRQDIGILKANGAENKQIRRIFGVEYFIFFLIAGISAFLLSVAVLKILFSLYMEITAIDSMAWVIFHIDAGNTMRLFLGYGAFLYLILHRTIRQMEKESIQSMLQKDEQTVTYKRRRQQVLRQKRNVDKTLAYLWENRTGKVYRECCMVSVAVAAVFLFLFCYLACDSQIIETSLEYEQRLTKQVNLYGSFTQEEIDSLRAMENVMDLRLEQEQLRDVYADIGVSEGLYVDTIWIKLFDRKHHSDTANEITVRFPAPIFDFFDSEDRVDYAGEVSKGIYLMLVFLFITVFVFVIIILAVKLNDYIEQNRSNIKILLHLGASGEVIMRSFLRQALRAAIISVLASSVLSVGGMALVLLSVTEDVGPDITMAAAYLFSAAALLGAFMFPVRRSLQQILKEYNQGRNICHR